MTEKFSRVRHVGHSLDDDAYNVLSPSIVMFFFFQVLTLPNVLMILKTEVVMDPR